MALSSWSKFRVRGLDEAGLHTAAAELAGQVRSFAPDLVIGIQTGGYVVAKLVAKQLQLPLLPITARRPSTAQKQKSASLKLLVRKLPRPLTDMLRIIEHIMLTELLSPRASQRLLDENELAAIRACQPQRVLIVDDAVDSGATLQIVREAVQRVTSAAIKTAAITVTTDSPRILPEFFLYRYILCRFPWSLDAK